MAIKVGFSTSVCPQWDLPQIVAQAAAMGYYGVELGTIRGQALPDVENLRAADKVRQLFEESNLELVSLASTHAFDNHSARVLRQSFAHTADNIELAARLGCPYVRLPLGRSGMAEPANATLARQVTYLRDLAQIAARNNVTLLVCNTGGFPSSRAVWAVADGVSHPGLAAAWDPMLGMSAGETSTLALPRVGGHLKMLMVSDASYDGRGQFAGFRPLGTGSVEYGLTIDLLKGMIFDGYLMLDWPKARVNVLPDPEVALPEALAFHLERIRHTAPALSAYGKDKNAPKWEVCSAFVARPGAGADAGEPDNAAEAAAQ